MRGKAWVGIGLAVLALTTWHSLTLMQDIPAVATACWDWLYITVLGLLSVLLNTDHSAKNKGGTEKDNKWLRIDKRSIVSLHTGPWLLYCTETVKGRSDLLSCSFILLLEKNVWATIQPEPHLLCHLDYTSHASIFLSYSSYLLSKLLRNRQNHLSSVYFY